MSIARLKAAADKIAAANIGYDQGDRWSFFPGRNKKLADVLDMGNKAIRTGEGDCSSTCGAIARLAGYPVDLSDPFWTGNFTARLTETGLFTRIKFTKLSQVKAGDFVIGPGHVIFARTSKKWWSAESDERGKASGGKTGDQTGREGRYRAPYMRSRGWDWIIRPIAVSTLQRRVLDAYKANQDGAVKNALGLLKIRAPWDGPRWDWFMGLWRALDQGMPLMFEPYPTGPGHAYIVLGSALSADGKITEKFRRRLHLALRAMQGSPDSIVIVSGGAARNGITEAAAGKDWLTRNGVHPDRIVVETKSASTIGNATGTLPLLIKHRITDYTLVSDASHLRRATILFRAAQLRHETANNKRLNLTAGIPLAYNDYGTGLVKPTWPVEPTTRTTVVGEVRQLLGL